jgi:hypothetical protein
MKKKNLIVGILEKKLTDSKDWTGNKASVYKTLAASNYSNSEREKNDFYATDPKAIDLLLEKEKFSDLIWEPACGQGHLSKRLEQKRQIRLNYLKYQEELADVVICAINLASFPEMQELIKEKMKINRARSFNGDEHIK